MSARLKGRRRHAERLIHELEIWAADVSDLRGVCVVGSYARGTPQMSSDLDLVLLSTEPDRYRGWLGSDSPLAPARFLLSRTWGPLTELRFLHRTGRQLDIGVTTPAWADTDPLDPGTARVIGDGLRIVHDPDSLLHRVEQANRRSIELNAPDSTLVTSPSAPCLVEVLSA